MIKKIVVIVAIFISVVSAAFAQTSKPVKEGTKVDHSKGASKNTKSSGSSHSSSSANAMKKRAHKASTKNANSSSIFPTFAEQMKGSKPYMSFNMKTKSSFSTMMTNYKTNSIFPNANTSQSGKMTFAGLGNKSNSMTSGSGINTPSNNNSKNLYKRRVRGPFIQNSSSYAKVKLFSLGRLHNKFLPEKKIEPAYNPNLHYYNLPKTSQ